MDRKRQKLSFEKNEAEMPCQEEEIAILRQKLLTVEAELKLNITEKLDLRKRVTSLEQELAEKEDLCKRLITLEKELAEKEYLYNRITKLEQELSEKEDLHKRITTLDRECTMKADQLNLVSNRSGDSIDDASCIAILKETIENIETELSQSHRKISELTAKNLEQNEGMSSLQRENFLLTAELKQIKKPFNACPNEVILEIFKRLPQNELGKMARVCRRWDDLTKSPILWQKVNVEFHWSHISQNEILKTFINKLPTSVTSIKVKFVEHEKWIQPLDFQELVCATLREKCRDLQKLILHGSKFSKTSVIRLGNPIFSNVTEFLDGPTRVHCGNTSKIEILDMTGSDMKHFPKSIFSKLPNLKRLYSRKSYNIDEFIFFQGNVSFLNQLEVLDLGETNVSFLAFRAIKEYGLNLKELYMCRIWIHDYDLKFDRSVFPQLHTICLKASHLMTCEGVVSLVESCPSLQNIYVSERVAESYAKHLFIIVNKCKLGIVKTIDCDEHDRSY